MSTGETPATDLDRSTPELIREKLSKTLLEQASEIKGELEKLYQKESFDRFLTLTQFYWALLEKAHRLDNFGNEYNDFVNILGPQ